MSNPEGKVAYSVELDIDEDSVFLKSGPQRFDLTLKFSNMGRRAMEEFLDMESPEITRRIGMGQLGIRMTTALLFGATRKFHARKFPVVAACDEFMDALTEKAEDEDDADLYLDFQLALLAANARTTVKDMRKRLRLDEEAEEDEEEDEDEEADEAPKATSGRGRAATKTGKSSSRKPSSTE